MARKGLVSRSESPRHPQFGAADCETAISASSSGQPAAPLLCGSVSSVASRDHYGWASSLSNVSAKQSMSRIFGGILDRFPSFR